VIKNSGHDFKGRSSGKDGFALWVHHLNETRLNRHFVPKGCHTPHQVSFTLGGGVQWLAAYKRANELNITIVGGAANQVGTSGGWIMVSEHVFFACEVYQLIFDPGWRSFPALSDEGFGCG
jgi:hypothetical protein